VPRLPTQQVRHDDDVLLPDLIDAGPVVLRRRRVTDVPELRAAIRTSVFELGAFLDWAARGVPQQSELEEAVMARDVERTAGREFEFVVREATSGDVVGEAGGSLNDDARAVEIGYWIRTDRTGLGYATAAASALTSAVFASYDEVAQVEIRMDKGNVRSQVIPRRLGYRLVGHESFESEPLRGQTGEGLIWAITRDEWRASLQP
jgi:ribosomal-protein-serine acetyltransferase